MDKKRNHLVSLFILNLTAHDFHRVNSRIGVK